MRYRTGPIRGLAQLCISRLAVLVQVGIQLPKAGDGGRWQSGMAATEAVCVHIHEGKGRVTKSTTVATNTLVKRSAIISHLEQLTQKKHPHK